MRLIRPNPPMHLPAFIKSLRRRGGRLRASHYSGGAQNNSGTVLRMTSTFAPTISSLCHDCDEKFRIILVGNPRLPGPPPTDDDHHHFLLAAEDCRGRFKVWASNLGASQPAKSSKSLDSRLKDAPWMRSSVEGALVILSSLIDRCKERIPRCE